jgi:hypothetical protein
MQAVEEQKQAAAAPAATPDASQGDSRPIEKKQHGGKRPGAGRKPNLAARLLKGFSKEAIAEAVSNIDCGAVIVGLLKSKRELTRLEALIFIRDLLVGRPAQNVQIAGSMLHGHIWRPLAQLSDEEMAQLDKLSKKLTAPASNASPDGPQNQIKSTVGDEAEATQSEA